uniref:Aminoacylase n=1 Tax=Timema poppense TaxID=170557 RepID=A0A7R9GZ11_TIMPO|nr:unnamed protein product [Timema poppensis]
MSAEKLSEAEIEAIANFREYLRIPSVHPNINYDECVSFLRRQASSLGLPIQVYHVVEGKPIVVITWRGSEPALPSDTAQLTHGRISYFKRESFT